MNSGMPNSYNSNNNKNNSNNNTVIQYEKRCRNNQNQEKWPLNDIFLTGSIKNYMELFNSSPI